MSARGSCSPTTAPSAGNTVTSSCATASATATNGRSARPTRRYASTPPSWHSKRCMSSPWTGCRSKPAARSGAEHGGHHDKSVGAYGPLGETILSICCCGACRRDWSVHGLDPEATVRSLCEAFEVCPKRGGRGRRSRGRSSGPGSPRNCCMPATPHRRPRRQGARRALRRRAGPRDHLALQSGLVGHGGLPGTDAGLFPRRPTPSSSR